MVLSTEEKQRLYRQRSALLSGLVVPEQPANVSPGLTEIIEHRERQQARQTGGMGALSSQMLTREQAQPSQAPA